MKMKLKEEQYTKFDNFAGVFEKQNQKLKIFFSITIIFYAFSFLMLLTYKNIYFIENVPFIEDGLKVEEVCLLGMKNVLKNKFYEAYMDKRLIENLTRKKIKFNFKGNSKYFRPVMVKDDLCHFVFKDEEGIAGFVVKMTSNSKYPFNHKIFDFDEIQENQEVIK